MSVSRPFYGWWIVVAASMIFGATVGFSFFSLGTLFIPLEEEYGWTRGEVSTALSLSLVSGGVFAPFVGVFIDRFGPRITIASGGLIIGICMILLARTDSYWQLIAVLLPMAVGRIAATNPGINVTLANWFVRRRPLAFGLSRIGLGLGSLIAVPLTANFVLSNGWRWAVTFNGIAVMSVILPLAVFVLRRHPSDLGLLADGDAPAHAPARSGTHPERPLRTRPVEAHWAFSRVIRARAFWSVSFAMLCFYYGELSVNLHMIPFLTGRGVGYQSAASIAGAIPAAYMGGGLMLGWLAGRFSQRYLISIAFVAISISIVLLWFVGGSNLVWIFIPLFGIAAGGILSLHASLLANLFGLRTYGLVLGGVTGVATLGIVVGPMLTGLLFDSSGGYAMPFSIAAAIEFTGALFVLFAAHPRRSATPAVVISTPA